ncbi:RPW8 domain-containing protein [Heracleum sosnowskyi]|uniref:RPW8 domain-containing protein n=1 Tax=Heracleum sosnowskyi TaxID=360622 RepID=A0AAD8H5H5_9APIA|nr:RPW8 domain-containing protein [Heracleum sosnowskyi]
MAFLTDAALGSGISELLKVVIFVAKQTINFKSNLKTLTTTLKSVEPTFENMGKLHKALERPKEETDQFIQLLKSGQDLVKKCSTVPCWNVYLTYIYSRKLVDLDKSIVKFFNIQVQGLGFLTSLRAEVGVEKCNDKLDWIMQNMKIRDSGFSFWGSVPGVPHGVVGFDQPLKDLKEMLLKEKEIVKVISAPGGCGKTTLAKMLCHDPDIQKIFGKNILFVTVSKSASITVIVEKIFKCRLPEGKLPDFQNDNDAINHLEYLLQQLSPSPILLVLDDVWSDWESLIDTLTFSLPYYKILVTSRFSFPRFNPVYELKILNDQDAMTLFRRSAFPKDGSSRIPDDLVEKTVKGCKGFPLALTVVGRSLYGHPEVTWRLKQKKWSDGKSILDTDRELLDCLQTSLDDLDEINDSSIKDCCLDLGSFPEDQRIPATTLMDMWAELYNLDDEDMVTFSNLLELSFRNLVTLVCTSRQTENEVDGFCNENHVTQHDMLRDLVIHQCNREPIENRRRLIIEITGNDFPKWWTEEVFQPIHARLLSISTDKNFSSSWLPLTLPAVEVIVLNCCSGLYTIPQFIKRMDQLKVLIITNNGSSFSKLSNFHLLGSLPILRRIRLERVSLFCLNTSLLALMNLQKISFTMCEIGKAFENGTLDLPCVFPNLTEIEIDCCDDLVELHVGLCEVVSLKKISITYCNELSALPEEIGRLRNLEVLRLNSCTKLLELPESIGNLHKLTVLDISDCLSMSNLPRRVGELRALKTFHMRGCQGLSELREVPSSVKDLTLLEKVICDEGASHLWESYRSHLKNLKVEEVKEDVFESLMRVISPFQHF